MSRSRAILAAVATVLATVSIAPASALRSAAPDDCARPVTVVAVGDACATPHGYEIRTADGATFLTHGADPVSLLPGLGSISYDPAKPAKKKPACVSDTTRQFYGYVIYARAADRPNRFTQKVGEVRDTIEEMNALLRQEAYSVGKRRLDYRVLCSRGEVFVANLALPTAYASTTFSSIVDDLRTAGYANPQAKYWIWFDGMPPNAGAAGVASMAVDDRLIAQNGNNIGSAYAVAFKPDKYPYHVTTTLMHEVGHTLGAVQGVSAPNGSGPPNGNGGGMHCNDGPDIMCYADNGSRSDYKGNVCSSLHFDCNHDDYFNPKPKAGSYLATHWNLASPLNRWLAGCKYATGEVTVGNLSGVTGVDLDAMIAEQTQWDALSAATVSIPSSCRGRSYGLSGWVPLPSQITEVMKPIGGLGEGLTDTVTPRIPALPVPAFSVCFFKGSTALACSSDALGKVPSKATEARILYTAGPPGTYLFNVV